MIIDLVLLVWKVNAYHFCAYEILNFMPQGLTIFHFITSCVRMINIMSSLVELLQEWSSRFRHNIQKKSLIQKSKNMRKRSLGRDMNTRSFHFVFGLSWVFHNFHGLVGKHEEEKLKIRLNWFLGIWSMEWFLEQTGMNAFH